VTKQTDELFGALTSEFNAYFGQKLEAEASEQKAPTPPAALTDLKPLAEKNGLAFATTGPMPWLEFRNTPVGKSGNPETGQPLSATLFGNEDLDLYQPILTMDIDGNRYISMKTSDAPGRVPKLAEVREQVIRAWKLSKAAEFALKDAEKQAKSAQESGSSLVDFYAGKPTIEVVRADAFSELTRGDVPDQFGQQRFRLSQPDGLVAVGPEFMKRVFALKNGETAAILNHDRTIAYVVRVVEHQYSEDELRNNYLAEANTWDGLPAMTDGHVMIAQQSVSEDLGAGKKIDWKRTPDRAEQSADAEE